MVFKNKMQLYRMEWDGNDKIAGLGGGRIPYPMMFILNGIAKGEFIGFDVANGKTIAINFLGVDKDGKATMEVNVGENKPRLLNNTGDVNLLPKRSAAELIYNIFTTKGITAVTDEMESIKNRKLDRFDIDAGELNDVGYLLLNENKINEAIAVFTIQTQEFPENANAFDSLAEALMKAGNKSEAIRNYKKSLEIDPENENARKMIEKLK
ncbi:MAG: tetratricopeptide repeat protein [Saprospiraceae bacterium]|nr:tetratricopeptide repeat protein [Saprospiraceae bacterium]